MTRNIARSSNGRTPGFGPVCGGSSPPRATTLDGCQGRAHRFM